MKIRNPDFWIIAGVILLGGLLTRSCSAQAVYDTPGTSSEGVDKGIVYFRSDDGNVGWQSTTNGVVYSHGSKRSCETNSVLGAAHTSCHEW